MIVTLSVLAGAGAEEFSTFGGTGVETLSVLAGLDIVVLVVELAGGGVDRVGLAGLGGTVVLFVVAELLSVLGVAGVELSGFGVGAGEAVVLSVLGGIGVEVLSVLAGVVVVLSGLGGIIVVELSVLGGVVVLPA